MALGADSALVGAFADDDAGSASGSAYVFTRNGESWAEQQKLTASDGAANDFFGGSVALSGDTALMGAPNNHLGSRALGSAYVFVRSASSWAQQDKLRASGGARDDKFGGSVALETDTALVGAYAADDPGNASGAAYVFVRSASSWAQQDKLRTSDGAAGDILGNSVALSGDTALVGADGGDGAVVDSGSAYVFVRSASSWAEQQKLVASDGTLDATFGVAVALSGDTALVGAPGDGAAGTFSGAAYVFARTASSWAEQQKLVASDGGVFDRFGDSVALSGDVAVVGDSHDDAGVDSGAAYVFVRTATSWVEEQKLVASDGARDEFFGFSVALSGATLMVGASGIGAPERTSGSVYVMALRLEGGELCTAADECASKFCVDGVCCDVACDGPCDGCNAAGLDGVCTLAARGSAPSASCNGYLCDGALASCPDSCAGDADCTAEYHCQGAVACFPKVANGESCSGAKACLSGHCVDGVCCAESCEGGCGSCQVPGLEGVCSPLELSQPGVPSCAPYVCGGGATVCPNHCSGHGDCAAGFHCQDGACSADAEQGAACSEGAACLSEHCTDGVCCVAESCGAYRCGAAGACETACSSSAQCATGYECDSADQCVPRAAPTASSAASDSGGCHVAHAAAPVTKSWPWFGAMACFASLALTRRRRRNRPASVRRAGQRVASR